jgi:hypothetical protein
MVVVARVAGRLGVHRRLQVFQHPEIAVDVVAFDLVGGSGDTPQEALWKSARCGIGPLGVEAGHECAGGSGNAGANELPARDVACCRVFRLGSTHDASYGGRQSITIDSRARLQSGRGPAASKYGPAATRSRCEAGWMSGSSPASKPINGRYEQT